MNGPQDSVAVLRAMRDAAHNGSMPIPGDKHAAVAALEAAIASLQAQGGAVAQITVSPESIDLHRMSRQESPLGDDGNLRAYLGDGLHNLYTHPSPGAAAVFSIASKGESK